MGYPMPIGYLPSKVTVETIAAGTITATGAVTATGNVTGARVIASEVGTAAAPALAITVSGSATYGLYNTSTSLGFSTAGTTRGVVNAGGWAPTGAFFLTSYLSMPQIGTPTAPAAGTTLVYGADNGASKTQLRALFDTGAAQAVATEP